MDDKDRVLIVARDAGPGISATQIEDILKPFFTTKPQGLGTGLAICRSIIQAHRSEILCSNNLDGGVMFRIALPGSRREIL